MGTMYYNDVLVLIDVVGELVDSREPMRLSGRIRDAIDSIDERKIDDYYGDEDRVDAMRAGLRRFLRELEDATDTWQQEVGGAAQDFARSINYRL